MNIDEKIKMIQSLRHEMGWSKGELSRRAGIPRSTLIGMDRADWSPSVATIRALELALVREMDHD